MSDRVSRIILLCEDDVHERLVRCYLKECGLKTEPPYFLPRNASREVHGGNDKWVLGEFAKELNACRRRHLTHSKTLLIVIVDADDYSLPDRLSQFVAEPAVSATDPLVFLVPKRHGETWIRAALGHAVNESQDCKNPEPKKSEFREAARVIHGWARDNPEPGPTCVPTLHYALPTWRKIG